MKASQLIGLLESVDPDAEVRLMTQPHWPFESSLFGTWIAAPQPDACGECGFAEGEHPDPDAEFGIGDHDFEPYNSFTPEGGDREVLYLLEGTQLGYGTRLAWEEAERPW